MKRLLLSIVFACAFIPLALAQMTPEEREDKIRSYRIAVFTEVLNLTSDEAVGFWPIYNEYQDKKEELQHQLKPGKQLDAMSDAEVEDYIKKYFELRQREFDLEKELAAKLRKVLPARKKNCSCGIGRECD